MKKIERCSFMSEYCIISDGSCDLPKDLAARENITVVPFYVSFDERNYMKEGVDIGVRDFYQKMVDNKGVFPKSSLPSVQDYMEVFEPIIKQGRESFVSASHRSSAVLYSRN
mgnify:CR=1 FL=1